MLAKLIKEISICILAALTIMAASRGLAFAADDANEETDDDLYVYVYSDYDKAYDVIERINRERSSRGIARLTPDQTLMDAALIRAAENILYFEHARPNGMSWDSVNPKVMGENLGRGTSSTSEIMRLWMESDGHRENVLRSEFRSVGTACIEHGGTYYWVQLFGTTGGSGVDLPGSGTVSVPLDLPNADSGSSFALDYSITGIKTDDGPAEIERGSSIQLGLLGDYLTFDPSKLKWTVSDPEIAEIDEEGVLKITGRGLASITAASGSIERAAIDIDTREDINEQFIFGALPFIYVLGPEGPLDEWRDYMMYVKDLDGDGISEVEIRGVAGYKGSKIIDINGD